MSRQRRQQENRVLMVRLNRDGRRIAIQFGLRYRVIEAERANVKARYGICYDDGTIRIRLRHAVSGDPLKYSSLVNTLCHEAAHLRYFDHSERFQRFYRHLLAWARREGIYQPRRADAGAAARMAPPHRPLAHPSPRPIDPRGIPPLLRPGFGVPPAARPGAAGTGRPDPRRDAPAPVTRRAVDPGSGREPRSPARAVPEQLSLFG